MKRWTSIIFLITFFYGCNNCRNNCIQGICIDGECECDVWYEGDACDKKFLQTFEGAYDVVTVCGLDSLGAQWMLKEGLQSNELQNEQGLILSFLDPSIFEIPNQNYQGQWVEGKGEMYPESFSMSLTFKTLSDTAICVIQGHR